MKKSNGIRKLLAMSVLCLLTVLIFAETVAAGSYTQEGRLQSAHDNDDGTGTIKLKIVQSDGNLRIWIRIMHATTQQINDLKTNIGNTIKLKYHNELLGKYMDLVLDLVQVINKPHTDYGANEELPDSSLQGTMPISLCKDGCLARWN